MSIADEIQKLEDLRRNRVLTESEFERAKAKLLDQDMQGGTLGDRMQQALDHPDDRTWGLIIHLSLLLGFTVIGIAVPIVIWQVMKDKSPAMDAHGINAANWMISLAIYLIVGALLTIIVIGIPLLILIGIAAIVFPIMGGVKAMNGIVWRYPLSIPFFKPRVIH